MVSPYGMARKRKLDYADTIKFSVGRLVNVTERTYHVPRLAILGRSKLVADAVASRERAGLVYDGDFPNFSNATFNSYVHLLLYNEVLVTPGAGSYQARLMRMALISLYILAAELIDHRSMNKVMDKLAVIIQSHKPRACAINMAYKLKPETDDPLRRLFVAAYTIGASRADDFQDLMHRNIASHQLSGFSFDLTMALLNDGNYRYRLVAADYYVEVERTPADG
ncbi:hypothetical protein CBER1_07497 [Cercospora berteroae]|uniref:BTB domain-containing protein n=1 Tax=Cercospora berteroae TaxID=357750 RepID=A0A2S6BUM5_9PEZI|nr:hypothetical protein CBER1_07497 [Cercospora berteroae]